MLIFHSFGYVEFANAADAAAAHAAKQGAELDGRKINVDFAAPRNTGDQKDRTQNRAKSFGDQNSEPTDTLWVGNISFQVDQDQLSTAFKDYGTIMGVRLPTDRETGALKGFGYVTYASAEEAKTAMDAMQGADLAGRSLRLDFSQPRPNNGDSPGRGGRGGGRGGFGDRGGRGGRGSFGGRGGGRGGFGDRGGRGGGRGGFGDRGRGGRGGSRGGFGDFSGKKTTF
jgi:nucleolin